MCFYENSVNRLQKLLGKFGDTVLYFAFQYKLIITQLNEFTPNEFVSFVTTERIKLNE